jgi:hypothetical protein
VGSAPDRVVGRRREHREPCWRSSGLRDQIELDSLSAEVRRVAGKTVRPTSAALWLKNVPDRPLTAIS